MKKKKSIDSMNYEELQKRSGELLFERFLGIILLTALFLGILVSIVIKNYVIVDEVSYEDYVMLWLSAYALLALGALGVVQIFLSTVDYHRCLTKLKQIVSDGEENNN